MNALRKKRKLLVSSELVTESVKEYIYRNHKFPQVTDIANSLGVSKSICNSVINQLVKNNSLCVVFEGDGLPRVVALCNMLESVLKTQSKPSWIKNYAFPEQISIVNKIEELQEKLAEYEQFERLLYSTGLQLEEAIAFSLNWLGFLNVTHLKGDKDNPDITFDYEEFHALVEAEGTNKQMSKDKVNQLGGWIQKELDREVEVSNIFGFLVINAFREKDLKERGDPLTQHAKNFLGVYRKMRYFRTSYLHEVVVRVLKGDLSKEAARKNIWEGEEIQ